MNTRLLPGIALMALPVILAGCESTSTPPPAAALAPAAEQPIRTGSQQDEGACERAVTQQTSNPDVVTLSSEFSEANTLVIVGVGPDRAKWKCLVSKGRVAEVMSLTDEGAL